MAKPKSGAKKATPAPKKEDSAARLELLKSASKRVAKVATKVAKAVKDVKDKVTKSAKTKAPAKASPDKAVEKSVDKPAKGASEKAPAKAKTAATAKGAPAKSAPEAPAKAKGATSKGGKAAAAPQPPPQERPRPRATKLPPVGEPLTKRETEQLLTAGEGRGVMGEGSLKGRLVVSDGMPHLVVVGRDKRELTFLLQGPDQEVLPAYVEHKVSVSGLIRKLTNYGGTVDVRKYSAKKNEAEVPVATPVETEAKLRYLSPGEVSMVTSAGMGSGIKGFASLRGNLEMTGEDFVLVLSNGGTRQQVSFLLEGKNAKGMRRHVGQLLVVTGVVEKASGWGGKVIVENFEPRPAEARVSREDMEIVHVEGEVPTSVDVKLNHGLTVRLQEQPGYTWAIEPTLAKRVGLREARYEPGSDETPATREFFFTPRNPGVSEVEFFLAKALTPGVVERSFKINVTVKP
ncbi:Chagasin family peptidase inhibitor I42 [Stigmatella aurantiaca]|uniref:Chagasin family peptidase inhibitor I42 n=1 Tax=Stigmatella aurantiaca TaxID=41 RepID=A0A1H7NB74_STIAU|nr:protease inhibitor I42 family protein [Stigmatella aurantiaca]SEL20218.1 Chagasin family peptidase inhibitor I42 [Stigmatella aurantiaca]